MMWLLALTACFASDGAPADPTSDATEAAAAPSPTVEAAVQAALRYRGAHYEWGGRNTAGNPGIDCLGLLFLAYGEATGTPWRRYAVNPSELVTSGLLGAPVPGLDAAPRDRVDLGVLRRGDVLYFLIEGYEIPDDPLWVRTDGARFWPWHTGIYLGDGLTVHASPSAGVAEQPLEEIAFDALFVTRLGG